VAVNLTMPAHTFDTSTSSESHQYVGKLEICNSKPLWPSF